MRARHLIWVLHSTHGLGVRPAIYSSTQIIDDKIPEFVPYVQDEMRKTVMHGGGA